MIYLESSALVRAILDEDAEMDEELGRLETGVASALTFLETDRALTRASLMKRLSPKRQADAARKLITFRQRTAIVPIDDRILERAREILPIEPVRSLDAIHLATAMLLREELGLLSIASTDRRIRETAEALGFALVPARRSSPHNQHALPPRRQSKRGSYAKGSGAE